MKERVQDYYFPIVKLIYIFSLVIYSIIINTSLNIDYTKSILQVGMLLIFTAIMVLYEILDKKSFSLLIVASIIGVVLFFDYQSFYSLLIPIIILDLIAYFQLPIYFYLLTFLLLLQRSENNTMYFIACTCCNIIYFQHYYLINRYKTLLNSFICNEESLKTSMENQNVKYKNEVEQFSLAFENKLLEEKSRLSQALHDKIGHSINGSIYQLEACKLLIDNDPEHSKNIVQAVIDNLRKSLDEIRKILRKEKPSKGELALLRLWKLCEDFNENYSINAKLTCSGESSEVPEYIWEVILDNSIEAFSNALKYSRCKNINISIAVLNKLVRCAISDDGIGCSNIKEGMGLAGIKERTKAVDGTVSVTSNVGFEINMLLPIKQLQKNN
jgi:signal transduction histidine kinase